MTGRPRSRSAFRMFWGGIYFSWRRRLSDWLSDTRFALKKPQGELGHLIFQHNTPLYRRLRSVDMWLQHNKVANLKIAAENINGVILRPGETFSFWRAVGRPRAKRGYQRAMVLHNGTIKAQTGGGLCQLSNLIYWMTLHTPLTVTERWRHTHDVFPDSDRTQPFGSGATVSYNYIDLRIKNDTGQSYQLAVWVGDTHLHGEWRSDRACSLRYRVYESEHCIAHQLWGGYLRHNVLRRRVYCEDRLISDQPVAENNAVMMYQPMLAGAGTCYNDGKKGVVK
ncbi:MAG TPA: vancomycin resistance protein [Desulfotomaculum sp.]|nr:vancomycin resistance protein [Desulfotomaculum sp.]